MNQKVSKAKSGKSIRSKFFNLSNKYWLLLIITSLTFIALSPALQNDFVRWDDHVYVTENDLIKEFSLTDLAKFGQRLSGNFHPLTLISLAIDHQLFGLNPFGYHLRNLIFHLFNTVLVFFFVMRLTRKNVFISFLTALLFGIHPMHVESVAWVSERKDVLYTFYFLIGLLLYYEYRRDKKIYMYLLMAVAFVLSVLSKSAAVVFPVVLLLIDYFENKKIAWKDLFQKIPLFIISLVFGIIAISFQSEAGAVDAHDFSIFDRLQYASSSFFAYIIKFIYPHELVIYRQFPDIDANQVLFLFSVLAAALTFAFLFRYRKKHLILFFGMSFFFVTIALVLQFIQVGGAFLSDRYTYVPYIGLGLIYSYYVERLIQKYRSIESIILIALSIQIGIYSIYTFSQAQVWQDTITLWTNLIEEESETEYTAFGYQRRGNHYLLLGDSTMALQDFTKSIEVAEHNVKGYVYRGNLYFHLQEYQLALADLQDALNLDPDHIDALKGMGFLSIQDKNYEAAKEQFSRVVEIDSEDYEAWGSLGQLYMQEGEYDKALESFDRAIAINSDYAQAIESRNEILAIRDGSVRAGSMRSLSPQDTSGYVVLTTQGASHFLDQELDLALDNFNRALQIRPDYAEARRGRAAIYWERKQFDHVIEDISVYLQSVPNNIDMRHRRAMCYMFTAQYQKAVDDFTTLIQSDPSRGDFFQGRGFAYSKVGNNDAALNDILKARDLGVTIDERVITELQKTR